MAAKKNDETTGKTGGSAAARSATDVTDRPRSAAAQTGAKAGETAGAKTGGAGTAAKKAARSTADSAVSTGRAVAHAPRKAVATAGTAWAVLKARKVIAIGAGAGAAVLGGAAYIAKQRLARRRRGPIARLTGGRLGS